MKEFYAKDTKMQENAHRPMVGLETNIEREKQFMSGVKEWKGFAVTAHGVGDDVTLYESTVDFIATNGQSVHYGTVAVARWKNGKIVHERFYYDIGMRE
jgi:ketosteroid isomerase-like protein